MDEPKPEGTSLTLKSVVPQVTVIIASSDGHVMGLLSGEAPELANLVETWCRLDTPMVQRADHEWIMAQSIYEVTVEWLLGIRFALVSQTLEELQHLPAKIPETARLTLVVTR